MKFLRQMHGEFTSGKKRIRGFGLALIFVAVASLTAHAGTFFFDDFNGAIKPDWLIQNPDTRYFTYQPTYLEVRASSGDIWTHLNNAKNIFLIPTPTQGDFRVTLRLNKFAPALVNHSQIDLLALDDSDNYVRCNYIFDTFTSGGPFVIEFASEVNGAYSNQLFAHDFGANPFELRLTKVGSLYTQSYSNDGVTFTPVNGVINYGNGAPAYVGFVCDVDYTESSIAQIDWFRVESIHPDLTFYGSPFVSPNPVGAGNTVSVSMTIVNSGSVTAAATTTKVQIKPSGSTTTTVQGYFSTPSIPAGGSITQNYSLLLPVGTASGAYTSYAILDNYNTAGQGNYANDQANANFTVGSSTSPVSSLVISGSAFAHVGPEYAYTVKANFANGSESDVTSQVRWSDSGWPRRAVRPDGTLTIGFDDPFDRPLVLHAQYVRPEGALTANFAITRGLSPDMHVFIHNPDVRFLRPDGSNFVWSLTCSVANTLNATGNVNYSWSLDGKPIGSGTAALNEEIPGLAGTQTLQVSATDSSGRTAIDAKTVVFNQPGLNEPGERYPAQDPTNTPFGDSNGNTFSFDANKVQHGLIVLVHGMTDDPEAEWIQNLSNAIAVRLYEEGKPVPNIAIYGWKDDANPAIQYGDGVDDEGFLARLLQVERAVLWKYDLICPGFSDFIFNIQVIRSMGLQHGAVLADKILAEINAHPQTVSPNAPIQLIGHSAGGFVVGEAARILESRDVNVTQVTMLDTPLPAVNAFRGTPQPPPVDRYVSSFFGTIGILADLTSSSHHHYRSISSLDPLAGTLIPTVAAHNYSREWYWNTVGDRKNIEQDGFYYSPFLGNHWSAFASLIENMSAASLVAADTSQPLDGFSTFGNVQIDGMRYIMSEAGNSGLSKDVTLPVGATSLKLSYQFTTPGDGDFLAIYFGDNPPIYIGSDLPLVRTAPLAMEIPILAYSGQSGKLVIKLVSRGAANAVLSVDQIALTISVDPDGDGLLNDQEAALGTDPLLPDTDGDSVKDGDEVNIYSINPLLVDSDGDGLSDADEITAGTDPLNQRSGFKVVSIQRLANGSFVLSWSAVADQTYKIIRSATPGFENFDVIADGLSGVEPTTNYTDSTVPAGTGAVFYRVVVQE